GRLIAGGIMIAIAIIWIVVENLMGLNGKQAVTPGRAIAVPTLPALATPQAFVGGQVNAALLGRQQSLPGHPGRAGYQFWVVAIQVTNDGSRPMHLSQTSFTLLSTYRTLGPGRAVTGHAAAFAPGGIRAGRQAEGDLYWQIADSTAPTTLQFIPPEAGRSIVWSMG
ncbi:MAG TPA: DUF4352 domain-containing protein, partial [Chloroflexota bacterium]|nr:DUF4352 domain-containing protein [Chloroflexota bacterium]